MNALNMLSNPYDPMVEAAIIDELQALPIIEGESIVIVDVSGSMYLPNGEHSRIKLAAALAIEIMERSEVVNIYATSGSDTDRKHSTTPLRSNGYLFWLQIKNCLDDLGGGGIFLEQSIEFIRHYHVKPNNLFVLTDDHGGDYVPTFYRDNLYVANLATYGEYEFHAEKLGLRKDKDATQ